MFLHHLWKIPGTGHQGYLDRVLGDMTHLLVCNGGHWNVKLINCFLTLAKLISFFFILSLHISLEREESLLKGTQ